MLVPGTGVRGIGESMTNYGCSKPDIEIRILQAELYVCNRRLEWDGALADGDVIGSCVFDPRNRTRVYACVCGEGGKGG